MLEAMLSLLTGGATGLLGTMFSGVLDHFERRQRHQHELELRRVDVELAKTEAASAERTAAIELEKVEIEAEGNALTASYREAMQRWSRGESAWIVAVDVVRGLLRPVLTLAFLALTALIYFHESSDVLIQTRIINTILYLTTTCVVWWFGGRKRGGGKAAKG